MDWADIDALSEPEPQASLSFSFECFIDLVVSISTTTYILHILHIVLVYVYYIVISTTTCI